MSQMIKPVGSRSAVLASLMAVPFVLMDYVPQDDAHLSGFYKFNSSSDLYYDEVIVDMQNVCTSHGENQFTGKVDLGITDTSIDFLCRELRLDFFEVSEFLQLAASRLMAAGFKFHNIDIQMHVDRDTNDPLGVLVFYVSGIEESVLDVELSIAGFLVDNPANLFFEVSLV